MNRRKRIALGAALASIVVVFAVVTYLFKPTAHDCTVTAKREYTIAAPYSQFRAAFIRRNTLPKLIAYRDLELVEQRWETWSVGAQRLWTLPELRGNGQMVVRWDDEQLGPQTLKLDHDVRIALRNIQYGSQLAAPSKNIFGYKQTATIERDAQATARVQSEITLRVKGRFPTVFESIVRNRVQRAAEAVLEKERQALTRLVSERSGSVVLSSDEGA